MERFLIKLIATFFVFTACTKDKGFQRRNIGYPDEIAGIILKNCATAGCHNEKSKEAAAGLSLVNWNSLFEGARSGAVVIPYRPDFSTLCYYTNTFSDLGPSLSPTMPVGAAPLSKENYLKLHNWIKAGAIRNDGYKYYEGTNRKFYITNQLCDLVMVVDAETKKIVRCIDVGILSKNEFPVCVKVSPDKKNWYVSFLASTCFQKFDVEQDVLISEINLGSGVWSSFAISADSKFAFCVDHSANGKVAYVDLESMTLKGVFSHKQLVYPRGIAIDDSQKRIYVGAENGNYVTTIAYENLTNPEINQIILDGSKVLETHAADAPQHLIFDETSSRIFVSCRNSQHLKVINTKNDSLIHSIFLAANPGFIANIPEKNLLFVSCNDDSLSFLGNIGSVKIVDTKNNTMIKTVNSGFQPNGLTFFKQGNYLAVLNSNTNPKGPAPHHTSACSGRNGYMACLDLNSFEMIPGAKLELAVYPYAIDVKE